MATDRSPSLGQVIQRAIEARLLDLNVSIPARVESYDAAKQRIDAKPLIKSFYEGEDGSTVIDALPVIPDVPVMFPGAGGFRLTLPVQVGDTVLLVFSQRSLDRWLAEGGLIDPQDQRHHALSDAVAFLGLNPGTQPWAGASTSDATMGKDGGPQLLFKGNSIHLGGEATEAAVHGDILRSLLSQILAFLASHTHVSPVGPTTPPIAPPPTMPPTLLSTIMKVK